MRNAAHARTARLRRMALRAHMSERLREGGRRNRIGRGGDACVGRSSALAIAYECDTLTPRTPLVGGYCINASRSGRAPEHRIG
jgi:hypothetical protein